MSKQLEQLGIFTEVDMAEFTGYWQQVPQVSSTQTYLKIINKFCEEFEFTPSA